MTIARKALISLQDTPYYHVVARCVRRAWLWGMDEYAGRDYSHRKDWVLERLRQLAEVFAIDVCAYAVMSNHYHLVLHVARRRMVGWSDRQVVERWTQLFSKPPLIDRWEQGQCGSVEKAVATRMIELWRHRLASVSWYMRCLNEHLARRANEEDNCTGRFWEGRFKSQALLDEAGLLTAMAYVDLNPIRAGIAETPGASEFTSIYQRIRQLRRKTLSNLATRSPAKPAVPLMVFVNQSANASDGLPFSLKEYLTLLDWTGQARAIGKRGATTEELPTIVRCLNIDARAWLGSMQRGGNVFGRALGRLDHMRRYAKSLGQSWIRGLGQSRRLYRSV